MRSESFMKTENSIEPVRHERLPNGLDLTFYDLSNRYFGDYHHVCIEVRCRIVLEKAFFASDADPQATYNMALKHLGETVEFRRVLTRMGVPGAEVLRVVDELIEGFRQTSYAYLQDPDFAERYVHKALLEANGKRQFTPRNL